MTVDGRRRGYLGLGSNVGDREAYLQLAVDQLGDSPGVEVVAISPVYETVPVGGPPQSDYLNAVVAVDTDREPVALLAVCAAVEQAGERTRGERWGPRTLDVDILLLGDVESDDPEVLIPHPRMSERDFVLAPLHDLAPDLVEMPTGGWSGVRVTSVALRIPG